MLRQRARSATRHQHNCLPGQSHQSRPTPCQNCRIAHKSARVSACTAGLVPGCLPCRSSYHHSNTVRVKSVSHQRAVSTPLPISSSPNRRALSQANAEHNMRQLSLPNINDMSDAESHLPPMHLESMVPPCWSSCNILSGCP